jgi:hypothetical protein
MLHTSEHLDTVFNDLVRFTPFDVGYEAYTAGIMLKTWMV